MNSEDGQYPKNNRTRKYLEYTQYPVDWDFQYDSYVSVLCRFGLLDYYWVPGSTWLAFLRVDCCALSLGTHEFSSQRSHALVLRSTCLYPVVERRNKIT